MRQLSLLIVTSIVFSTAMPTANSLAEDEFPDSILGFFKPNMYVAVATSDAGKFFTAFEAKADMEISRDAQVGMELADLRKKYPSVERQIFETIKKYNAQIRDSEPGSGTNGEFQEPTVRMNSPSGRLYGRIVHVGANYMLLEYIPSRQRYVVPERRITGVALDRSGLDLYVDRNRTKR